LSETDLDENEKPEVVRLLKQQIDQFPEPFINKYLDVDILPMHIDSKSEFGYNLDHRIIIEAGKIKQGMSYRNSVKSGLAHQIAYLLMEDPNTKEAADNFQNYLNSMYQTFHGSQGNTGYSIYEQGYISRYANGEITGNYSAAIEFAELFAHLTCEENRVDVLAFLEHQPENILSIKVNRFIDFVTENVDGFNREYFFPSEMPAYTTPAPNDVDGEVLLSIHELRSYEAIDFEAMNTVDKGWASNEKKDIYEDLPTKSWEGEEPEVEYQVYSYSENADTFYPKENQNHQSPQKKKKKKNGRGLLIAGAAIYVLLQLAK
jgi:hypothetical protein